MVTRILAIENVELCIERNPANKHMLEINNGNIKKRCEICLKVTIMTLKRCYDVTLVPLLLTLNIFYFFFQVSVIDFEQVNICWETKSQSHGTIQIWKIFGIGTTKT